MAGYCAFEILWWVVGYLIQLVSLYYVLLEEAWPPFVLHTSLGHTILAVGKLGVG